MHLSLRTVLFVFGLLLIGLGVAMTVPMLADLVTGSLDWRAFAQGAAITLFVGGALAVGNLGRAAPLTMPGAFLLTAGSWFILGGFSALPLFLAGLDLSVSDAYFEAVSGLTTTGSTVLSGLDSMAAGVLLWRAMLQWMGGLGIIVMAISILPVLRIGGMQLFRLESSDTSEKLLPRASEIARSIAAVYVGLTSACALSYGVSGMNAFEAITHAMTTIATGGFSTSDRSMGAFTEGGTDIVCVIFMLLSALPFSLYVLAVRGRPGPLLRDDQVRLFLSVVTCAVAALTVYLWVIDIHAPVEGFRLVLFNVVSVVTTTGYATSDYTLWGPFASAAFFGLTFFSGCSGSTSGGIKAFRFYVAGLALRSYVMSMARPHIVHRPYYNGRPVSDETVFSVLSFLFMYLACFTLLSVLLSMFGLDVVTATSGVVQAMGNVGPGLGPIIGPAGNFASLPDGAKWVLTFGMILGRLEVITVLALLTPSFWRG